MPLARYVMLLAPATLATILGCSQSESEPVGAATADAQRSDYLLSAEPTGAQDVLIVRQQAEDNDEVTVVGRIGGNANPWIDGRAAFSIVDLSLKACSDIEGDTCPKPWDYCCETDRLPSSQALIKLVDSEGNLVGQDARELLGLGELQTVVVHGKAQRDEAGNLTVLADGIYVRR